MAQNGNGYLILKDGVQSGPFDQRQLQSMIQGGLITRDDLAWAMGMPEWRPVWEVAGLAPPPPVQVVAAEVDQAKQPRVRAVVPSYMWLSGISMLCCLPCGIVAMVYSCQVPIRLREGDVRGAKMYSKKVVEWSVGSFALVLAGMVWVLLSALFDHR